MLLNLEIRQRQSEVRENLSKFSNREIVAEVHEQLKVVDESSFSMKASEKDKVEKVSMICS